MPGVISRIAPGFFVFWRSALAESGHNDALSLEKLLKKLKVNVAQKLVGGDTGLASELERIHDLERRLALEKARRDEEKNTHPETEGLLERLKVKRRKYTLSEAALRARQENALKSTGPTTPEGKAVSARNAWKHGKYARSFVMRYMRPCKSTCPQYPCSIVEEGRTAPGGECLEKEHVIEAFNAILKAALNQQFDEFNALAALEVAKNIEIVRKLQEAVLDDGVVVYSEKVDKDGNVIGKELKPHPALLALPKLIADLGLTPQEMMLTPRQLVRAGREDEGIKSLADLMSSVSSKLKGRKKDEDDSGNG